MGSVVVRRFRASSLALLGLTALVGLPSAVRAQQPPTAPATDQQLFLYQGMGANVVCNLVTQGVPFAKAFPSAIAMVSGAIAFGHGSQILQGGKPTKLDPQQLQNGAAIGIAGAVLNSCAKDFKGEDKVEIDKLADQLKKMSQGGGNK
jgi:hypothetical protein